MPTNLLPPIWSRLGRRRRERSGGGAPAANIRTYVRAASPAGLAVNTPPSPSISCKTLFPPRDSETNKYVPSQRNKKR